MTVTDAPMSVAEVQARYGKEYITALPASLPADRVLVHNQVIPRHPIGSEGFRVWLQADTGFIEPCPCGWAPRLPQHYRVTPMAGTA